MSEVLAGPGSAARQQPVEVQILEQRAPWLRAQFAPWLLALGAAAGGYFAGRWVTPIVIQTPATSYHVSNTLPEVRVENQVPAANVEVKVPAAEPHFTFAPPPANPPANFTVNVEGDRGMLVLPSAPVDDPAKWGTALPPPEKEKKP